MISTVAGLPAQWWPSDDPTDCSGDRGFGEHLQAMRPPRPTGRLAADTPRGQGYRRRLAAPLELTARRGIPLLLDRMMTWERHLIAVADGGTAILSRRPSGQAIPPVPEMSGGPVKQRFRPSRLQRLRRNQAGHPGLGPQVEHDRCRQQTVRTPHRASGPAMSRMDAGQHLADDRQADAWRERARRRPPPDQRHEAEDSAVFRQHHREPGRHGVADGGVSHVARELSDQNAAQRQST